MLGNGGGKMFAEEKADGNFDTEANRRSTEATEPNASCVLRPPGLFEYAAADCAEDEPAESAGEQEA